MQGAHEAGALAPLAQGSIGSVPPLSLQRDDSMAELPSAVFCPLPMPPPVSVSRSGTPALELMNYGPTPVLPSPAPTPGNPPIPAGRFPRAPALRVEVSLANLRHGPLALPEKTPVASPAPTPTMWPGSGNNGNRFPVAEDVSAPVATELLAPMVTCVGEWTTALFCFDRHAEPVQASATDVGHSAAARQRPSTGQRVRPVGHAAGVGHAVDDDDDDDDGSLLSLTHEPSAGHRMGRLVGQGLGVPHSPTEEAHEPSLQITRA